MDYITTGKVYNKGKVAFIKCEKNGDLSRIHIKDNCYLLVILSQGSMSFEVGDKTISVSAPSFLCFNELEDPVFNSCRDARYVCIYFHPKFLNINMTFELLRSRAYSDIATTHDMFMLKPFLNNEYVVPIGQSQLERIEYCADGMIEELENQRDWYWSCRGRSYFMEIIIMLERMYGIVGYGFEIEEQMAAVSNPIIRDVVLYIEGNYANSPTLADISASVGFNHSTVTALMKKELGCTVMEFLMRHRVLVAKKQLAFTEVPIKDISTRTGFKTVQHFTRVFKAHTGKTPADFRKSAVDKRKKEINK